MTTEQGGNRPTSPAADLFLTDAMELECSISPDLVNETVLKKIGKYRGLAEGILNGDEKVIAAARHELKIRLESVNRRMIVRTLSGPFADDAKYAEYKKEESEIKEQITDSNRSEEEVSELIERLTGVKRKILGTTRGRRSAVSIEQRFLREALESLDLPRE